MTSNTENSLDDFDDNVDEFGNNGDFKNIQKLKNSSLMSSIAKNTFKHHTNAKEFDSLINNTHNYTMN
jgi:hypothetical protein